MCLIQDTTNKQSSANNYKYKVDDKEYILSDILNQSLYILITLNIMGTILKNYTKIRDKYNDLKISITDKSTLNITILTYIKDTLMFKYLFDKLIKNDLDPNVKDQKNQIKYYEFPRDKKFEYLTPFYEFTDNQTQTQKYILFTSKTSTIINEASGNNNKYLLDLIDLLFKTESNSNKYRYNFNVIRPMRETYDYRKFFESTRTVARMQLQDEKHKSDVLEATLVETIQGFCDIRKGDV